MSPKPTKLNQRKYLGRAVISMNGAVWGKSHIQMLIRGVIPAPLKMAVSC